MLLNKQVAYGFFFLLFLIASCNNAETPTPEKKIPKKDIDQSVTIELSKSYKPPLFFFTSYRCPSCGSFGKPVTEQVFKQMGDTITPFVCHFKYGDPFENQTNLDIIASQAGDRSSPQIWLDGKNIIFPLFRLGKNESIKSLKKQLRVLALQKTYAFLGLEATINTNNRWDVKFAIENNDIKERTYFVEVYTMEDSLISIQKGAEVEENQIHNTVIRGSYYGNMGKEIKLEAGESIQKAIEIIPCVTCKASKLYYMVIAWEKLESGNFKFINGLVKK